MYRSLRFFAVQALAVIALAAGGCGGAPPPQPETSPPVSEEPTAAPAPATPAVEEPAPAPKEPPHFMYSGDHGPDKWGEIWPEWKTCKDGTAQSPIDLPKAEAKPKDKADILVSYTKMPLSILNNGHTVQVSAAEGEKITIGGTEYQLAQFHLHAPSEHTVEGKPLDGELHLVNKNAQGEIAVIGLLLKKGKANKLLSPVFAAAPAEESEEAKPVADATVDLSGIIAKKSSFYTYSGSLTTPPCTEGVKWYVVTKPIEVSEAQLAQFTKVMHGANARPVQPLGSRDVAQASQ